VFLATGRLRVVTKIQDELTVRLAYDEVADTYANHFRATEPELPVELAMVEHFTSLLSGERRVLDAGCGAGRMMPYLATLGCRVEGVDLSPEMIRRSRRDRSSFPSRVASLTDLPFTDGSFEGVFLWYATIRSPNADLPQIMREVRRVLRPAGLVLVAFQSGRGVQDVSDNYRRRGHDIVLHRYNRTPEEIARPCFSGRDRGRPTRSRRSSARTRRPGSTHRPGSTRPDLRWRRGRSLTSAHRLPEVGFWRPSAVPIAEPPAGRTASSQHTPAHPFKEGAT